MDIKDKNDKNKYFSKLESEVSKRIKNSRFRHTLGVAYTASCLAMRYGADTDSAYLAGLLHDVAKNMSDKEMVRAAKDMGIKVTEFDREHPFMLHGPVGAMIAQREFGIRDRDVLNAIANHTVGRRGMSLLEEIVFVADYIENGRDKAADLEHIRRLAFEDIKKCIGVILENTLKYLNESREDVDKRILEVLEDYEQ